MLLFSFGCKSDDSDSGDSGDSGTASITTPSLDMNAPDSITGGKQNASSNMLAMSFAATAAATSDGPDCSFNEVSGNPFQNGYSMTKFLVNQTSTWSCMSEFMMNAVMAMGFPTDGTIQSIPSDPSDSGGPTGVSITQNSSTQNTIRLYFNNDSTTPGMFISWNTVGNTTEGRLVLGAGMMSDGNEAGAPNQLRMDFNITSAQQVADLFLAFPAASTDIGGFRTEVTKTLSDSSFVARGRMDMKGSFGADATMDSWTPKPAIMMYAITDSTGKGAASSSMANMGFPLGGLGYYQFTMADEYFFTATGTSEYVNKSIPSAVYKEGRTIADASADSTYGSMFGLPGSYFQTTCNNVADADCDVFITALFSNDNFGQEQNSGTDPGDSRSTVINALTDSDYLSSVYPAGSTSWTGVFDMSFTPSN
ncbi:MAG: hypothetical protein COB67_07965 [SAR324 cluster bacterium]|uniref:Uncharacterized protein n=1 Tax=SAR324 cluster bacterium TaxID=2024889 RepID=A0A2A4T2G3_9DELT|nr:MAG: hypothetical protein COB67_07965 [SAR324 cluster bacterium]